VPSKTYILILVAAIAILLFSATMAYRQIKQMQLSAEMVSQTHKVKDGISTLFSHYFRLESEDFKAALLNDSITHTTFENYVSNGKIAFLSLQKLTEDNPLQQKKLEQIDSLQDTLYEILNAPGAKLSPNLNRSVSDLLLQIRTISNEMRAEENRLMKVRENAYTADKVLAPWTLLILGIFSLVVFILAFIRIYKEKLRYGESDAFLRSVLSNTDNIINFYTPIYNGQKEIKDFKIEFANACNRDYLGLEPEEIIGKKVSEVFPFLRLNGELEELVTCFEQQRKITFNRQIAINGKKMWFRSSVNPLLDGILVAAQNVTNEEEAKAKQLHLKEQALNDNEKLREAQLFLSNILKSTDNVISYFTPIYDANRKIIDFMLIFSNDNIKEVLQKEVTELEQKRMSEILPGHFENGVFDILVKCITKKKVIRFEKQYEFHGKKFWFKTTALKLDNGVLTTSINTTAEKDSEQHLSTLNKRLENQNLELLDSRAFLTNILKSISQIVMHLTSVRDSNGNITDFELQFVNDKIKPYTGDESTEIIKKRASEIFPTIFTSGVFEKLISVVESDTAVEYETPFQNDGQPLWFHATAIKLGDGVTVTIREITKEKYKKELLRVRNLELTRSNTELEAFNRIASHDLQEPLRKIQMFISMIEDDSGNSLSNKNQAYFQKIEKAAQRMQALIVNLLTYSRIEGKHENFEKVNLNQLLAKVKEDLAVSIAETSAKIQSEKLPKIQGVPYQLEQLFSNLISNAIKYRVPDHSPIIDIYSEKVHQEQIPQDFFKTALYYHKITIKDNGIGFLQEHSLIIFEVFQRLHQKSTYSGTGIGLAICKKIVDNHHGFIYATGQPENGAAFIFYLPA
jgi:signal transduction histidine kinase/PAS domain-containing protein